MRSRSVVLHSAQVGGGGGGEEEEEEEEEEEAIVRSNVWWPRTDHRNIGGKNFFPKQELFLFLQPLSSDARQRISHLTRQLVPHTHTHTHTHTAL